MTYVAGTFLGIVVGFGLAALLARRRPGDSPRGHSRIVISAIAAIALVAASIVLARRDHGSHDTTSVAPATTSTAPPETSSTAPPATQPRAIVRVPDLVGKTRAEALATLKKLALVPNLQTLATSSVPPDFVLSQNPVTESRVTEGSTVSLVVSAAP